MKLSLFYNIKPMIVNPPGSAPVRGEREYDSSVSKSQQNERADGTSLPAEPLMFVEKISRVHPYNIGHVAVETKSYACS